MSGGGPAPVRTVFPEVVGTGVSVLGRDVGGVKGGVYGRYGGGVVHRQEIISQRITAAT